jgi:hypothetical protein
VRLTVAVAALTLAAGCSGATTDPGLDALLRVPGAQFHRGAAPAAMTGPKLGQFTNASSIIRPGELNAPVSGVATRDTTGIAIYLVGDPGYWIIAPGAEDGGLAGQLDFSAKLSFSPLLPDGTYSVIGRAVNAAGQFGPPTTLTLNTPPDTPTASTLLVSLRWDTEADLDLHLVIPDGTEIWSDKINSFNPPPPGQMVDAGAYKSGGILDFDSNSNCVIDGRRLENIYWTETPPSGHYIARVDTWSLCGVPQANWHLDVTLNGNPLGSAAGSSLDSDAALPHGKGDGLTALQFDVP